MQAPTRARSITLVMMMLSASGGADAATSDFSGILGFYAAAVNPEAHTLTVIDDLESNADRAFPLASSFKPAILHEVLRLLDDGTLDWNEQIEIPIYDRSLDGGRIPSQMKAKKLVGKMIGRSHNTSADVLFKRVGLAAPSATLSVWGLGAIRVTTPTREFWLALSGLVPEVLPYDQLPASTAAFDALDRAQQVDQVEALRAGGKNFSVKQIDRATRDFYRFGSWNQSTSFTILDHIDNVGTPRQMVGFLYRLFLANDLSPARNRLLRRQMARGDGASDRHHIKVPLIYWGGKGGSDLGMGSVIGYGHTAKGTHILYAIMGSRMIRENSDWKLIESRLTEVFDSLDGS